MTVRGFEGWPTTDEERAAAKMSEASFVLVLRAWLLRTRSLSLAVIQARVPTTATSATSRAGKPHQLRSEVLVRDACQLLPCGRLRIRVAPKSVHLPAEAA